MRVVIERATGRILEAQPHAAPGAMLDAIVAGGQFADDALEEINDPSAPADLSARYYNAGRWDITPTVKAAQDAKPIKDQIAAIEAEAGFSRKQREALIAGLPDCDLRRQLQTLEARVAVERARLPESLRGVRA